MPDSLRLDRYVADLLHCSRAEAQQYVEGGWVSVDGVVAEQPQLLLTSQQVDIDPNARLAPAEPATLLLHKPAGLETVRAAALATPAARSADDASGVRMLQRHFQRLASLMPLDADAAGMLVLSQDPRARRRLVEDYATIEQEFVVEVAGDLAPYGLNRLAHGLHYQGRALPPCKVSWQNEIRLRFAIKDVRPGQLRHMCAEVGLAVVALKRIRIGRIALGKMAVGEWRYLPAGARF